MFAPAGFAPGAAQGMWSRRVKQVGRTSAQSRFVGRSGRALALAAAALLAGCASINDHRGYIVDTALLQSVQPRIDNKYSVEQTLGRPTFVSEFGQPTWYYISDDTRQPPFRQPHTTKETVLRVRFDTQGNVTEVQTTNASHLAHIHPDGALTPTLGRKRSFLEDIFGNIGTVGAAGAGAPAGGSPGGGPNGS